MGQRVKVAGKDELKNGEMKAVSAAGHDIVLARVGDIYYAAESRCPHLGGNLARGKLEGTVISCPLQGSQFDLTDGKVIRWTDCTDFVSHPEKLPKPPRPLRVYKVEIQDDNVLVEI